MFQRKKALLIILFVFAGLFHAPALAIPVKEPRLLVLLLDGIPFDLMQEAQEKGFFNFLHPTSRLISPFPSITNPSFAKMFSDRKLPGYVRGYFNIRENRREENYGPLTPLVGAMSWEKEMNYANHRTLLKLGSFVFPLATSLHEMDSLEEAFFESQEPIFFGYIASTDAVCHMLGREGAMKLLEKLDGRLRQLLQKFEKENGHPLSLVVISDHGNSLTPLEFRDWESLFARRGFHYDESLRDDRSIIKVVEGFSTVTTLHTTGKHDFELATLLVEDKAVDLVVTKKGGKILIISAQGTASLEKREAPLGYRYRPLTGDPLNYQPLFSQLAREGQVDPDGFVQDRPLFSVSRRHRYPDALYRIDEAFSITENPPNLIISLKDGYTSADRTLLRTLETFSGIYAHVEGSHGALLASHSLGVFASNFRELPDIRPDELREFIDLARFGLKSNSRHPVAMGH